MKKQKRNRRLAVSAFRVTFFFTGADELRQEFCRVLVAELPAMYRAWDGKSEWHVQLRDGQNRPYMVVVDFRAARIRVFPFSIEQFHRLSRAELIRSRAGKSFPLAPSES
jgi:hypothetical protein